MFDVKKSTNRSAASAPPATTSAGKPAEETRAGTSWFVCDIRDSIEKTSWGQSRLIAERAEIQTIVLDNEGEFASLREAVELVGASGELPANPRHAALLARRLLDYKVSAVIDLYELKLAERRRFVRPFLESLIHLSRDLWRPTLVILDEAATEAYLPRGSHPLRLAIGRTI